MTKIEFFGEIWDSGKASVLTIPRAYIKNGQLKQYTLYKIIVTDPEEVGVKKDAK